MGQVQSRIAAERLKKWLTDLLRELVDRPDEVSVSTTVSEGGNTVVLTVRTADGEVGKVIGKQGRTAQAVRSLLEAVAAKYKQRAVLEIDDNKRRRRRDGG